MHKVPDDTAPPQDAAESIVIFFCLSSNSSALRLDPLSKHHGHFHARAESLSECN